MFTIDAMAREPVYEQIINQLERFILGGILCPGDQLQSIRSLSLELSINPNTVQKAFSALESRGLIRPVPGKGYFISENATDILSAAARGKFESIYSLLCEMAAAGIDKSEMMELLEKAYSAR